MSEYLKKWENRIHEFNIDPRTWHTQKHQVEHVDRKWIYQHVDEPVLDIGCGTAIDGLVINEYVGLDVTPSFLMAAREFGVKNLVIGDARSLPFRNKCFNTGYTKDLLLHLPWDFAKKVISELLRCSKKTFIAWGINTEKGEPVFFTPTNKKNTSTELGGFLYNRFSRKRLKEICIVGDVVSGTSITEVKEK